MKTGGKTFAKMATAEEGMVAGLSRDEFESLSQQVQEKLQQFCKTTNDDADVLKIKYEKLRVNLEQQCFDLEKQLGINQTRLEETTKWSEELGSKVSELEAKNTDLTKHVNELESNQNKFSREKSQLQSTIDEAESEKKDLVALLDKRNVEIERLNDETKRLIEKIGELNRSRCEAVTKADELASQEMTLQFREQRLEQEHELLNKQIDWLNTELKDRSSELSSLRRDRSKEILNLQLQVDERTEELKLANDMVENLKTVVQQQTTKSEEFADKLKESRDSHLKLEEHFQQQLRAQAKLTDLYKASMEDEEKRTAELVTVVGELQSVIQKAGSEFEKSEEKLKADKRSLQEELDMLRSKTKTTDKELIEANKLLSALRPKRLTADAIEALAPAAAAASNLLKSGKSLTQIYSEHVEVSEQLQLKTYENQKLQLFIEQITQEIEERVPQLMQQRDEYEKTVSVNAQLTQQLEAALQENEQVTARSDSCQRQSRHLQRENDRLVKSIEDLGRQIRILVKEVEELRGNHVDISNDEMEIEKETTSSNSADVITDKLVSFRNIEELQRQNQRQLAVIRELGEKHEQAEEETTNNKISELQRALQLASDELEELRTTRSKQTEMLESILRQKEMYRVLLGQVENQPLTSTPSIAARQLLSSPSKESTLQETKSALQQLQEEFAQYRKERSEQEKFLTVRLDKFQDESSEARLLNAKLSAQLEHSNERFKILQTNVESFRKEITALTAKNQRISTSLMKQEQVSEELRHDLLTTKEKLSRSEVAAENFRLERDLLKSVEARLLQEKEMLHKEQTGQAMVVANLQAIQNNLERAEAETKLRFTHQNEVLEKDVTTLRKKLDAEIDNYKSAVSAWENERKHLHERLEAEIAKQQKTREELVDAYAQVHRQKQDLAEVQAKLAVVESRLKMTGTESTDLSARAEAELISKTETSKDIESQLTEAKMEIKMLKDQLQQVRNHLEQFKTITASSEEQHKAEIETNKQYKDTLESRLQENIKVLGEMEQKVQLLEKEKQDIAQENRLLVEKSANDCGALRKELNTVQVELQFALQQANESRKIEEEARRDCLEQAKLAREAQDKYERELMLHAADVQALSTVKEQLDDVKGKFTSAEESAIHAQRALQEGKKSLQDRESIIDADRNSLMDRCEQLRVQNDHLHNQMERMSSQMLALQDRTMEEKVNITLGEDSSKSSEQLMEVIRFLRREKEIANTKSEVNESENLRFSTRVTFLQKQVDELQARLKEEVQKSDISLSTHSQHLELMRKVGMLNTLTENNKLLMDEKNALQQNKDELMSRVQLLETEIAPLQERNRELQATCDSLTADTQVLKNEVKRWQTRTNQLVDQNNRANPEDLKRANQEKEVFQKQVTQLTEECQRHRAEISRLVVQMTSVQNEFTKHKAAAQKKEKELEHVTEEISTKDAQITEQSHTIQQVKKIARKYKTQHDDLKVQYDELSAKMAQQPSTSEASSAAGSSQDLSRVELENRLRDAEQKLEQQNEQMKKMSEKSEEQLKTDNQTKEKQSKKILQNATRKISQLTTDKETLMREMEEQRKKLEVAEQSQEEKTLLLNTLKSQLEGQVGRLERELKDLNAQNQQVVHEKETMQKEMEELKAKLIQMQKQLESQTKQLPPHLPTKIIPVSGPMLLATSTVSESPPTANIKPLSTPSPTPTHRLAHPHTMASSSTIRSTPTASIRPMALTRKVTLVPASVAAPSSAETVSDGASTSSVPQATVTPTTVVPPIMVTVSPTTTTEPTAFTTRATLPTIEEATTENVAADRSSDEAIVSTSVVPSTIQMGTVPSTSTPTIAISPRVEPASDRQQLGSPQVSERKAEENLPSHSDASSVDSTTTTLTACKRGRDDESDSNATLSWGNQQKRSRIVASSSSGKVMVESSTDEGNDNGSARTAEPSDALIEEDNPNNEDEADTEPTSPLPSAIDDDIIIVESDDDAQVVDFVTRTEDQNDSDNDNGADEEEHEDEDDNHEEGMEGDDSQDGQSEADEHMHEQDFGEEGADIMDEEQFEDVAEEMSDSDYDIEIIDDDDEEDDNEDDDQRMEEQEGSLPPDHSESLPQQNVPVATSGSSSSRTQFPPRIPLRTERLPSLGRQQLTPFMSLGGGSNFDDGDDSIVPSTPTLFVPRRNDGFAEAVSSPHVPSSRFVFGASQEMVVPSSQATLSQLAAQGGVDDTRMDLSQFDESGGRSVPTTPLQISPPAETLTNEMSNELPLGDQAPPSSPTAILVPDVGAQEIPTITVTTEQSSLPIQELGVESSLLASDDNPEPTIEEPDDRPTESYASEGPTVEEIVSSEDERNQGEESKPVVTVPTTPERNIPGTSRYPPSHPRDDTNESTHRRPIVWTSASSRRPTGHSPGGMRGQARRMRVHANQGHPRQIIHRGGSAMRVFRGGANPMRRGPRRGRPY